MCRGVSKEIVWTCVGFSDLGMLEIPYWTDGTDPALFPIGICVKAGRVPKGLVTGTGVSDIRFWVFCFPNAGACISPNILVPCCAVGKLGKLKAPGAWPASVGPKAPIAEEGVDCASPATFIWADMEAELLVNGLFVKTGIVDPNAGEAVAPKG